MTPAVREHGTAIATDRLAGTTVVLAVRGHLDLQALDVAYASLQAQQAMLCSSVADTRGRLEVVAHPVALGRVAFARPLGDPVAAAHEMDRLPFDLQAPPLARVLVLRTDEGDHVALRAHEVVGRERPAHLLLADLADAYRRAARCGADRWRDRCPGAPPARVRGAGPRPRWR